MRKAILGLVASILAANIAAAADLALEVKLPTPQAIDISLVNQTGERFFVLFGGLCKGAGAPAFRLVLRRDGQIDEPLVLGRGILKLFCRIGE